MASDCIAEVSGSIKDAAQHVLEELEVEVDYLLKLCEPDEKLAAVAFKFKVQHAANKAAHDSNHERDVSPRSSPPANAGVMELLFVLQRMAELAISVAQQVLERTESESIAGGATMVMMDASATAPSYNSPPTTSLGSPQERLNCELLLQSSSVMRNSSVEDLSKEGTEMWIEAGATLQATAIEILALVLVAHRGLTTALQNFLAERCDAVNYVDKALAVRREHEMHFFAEGYRTGLIRFMANLTFNNKAISTAVVANKRLAAAVVSAVSIDDDNPGMREWAVLAVRNICSASTVARDVIRGIQSAPTVDENGILSSSQPSSSAISVTATTTN